MRPKRYPGTNYLRPLTRMIATEIRREGFEDLPLEVQDALTRALEVLKEDQKQWTLEAILAGKTGGR